MHEEVGMSTVVTHNVVSVDGFIADTRPVFGKEAE